MARTTLWLTALGLTLAWSAGAAAEEGGGAASGGASHATKPLAAVVPQRPTPSRERREEMYREYERARHARHRHQPCISPSRPDRDCFDDEHDDDGDRDDRHHPDR